MITDNDGHNGRLCFYNLDLFFPMKTFKKLLIAIDSTACSLQAAETGMDLARQLKAEVALLFVVNTSQALGNPDAGFSREDELMVLKREAEQSLDQIADMAGDLKLGRFMPEGHPSEELLRIAKLWEADLIVMGTHGYKGVQRLLKGSLAEQTIRSSMIPVMVIHS